MTIIDRYLFRQVATLLLIILLPLTGVVWIGTALQQLSLVTSEGQDAWMLFKITTLTIPNFLALIAPFALQIAAIQTLHRLNSDSELIVLTASGAPVWTIARPLIVLSLIVAGLVAFVNHVGMPWSLRVLNELIVQVRTNIISQVLQPGQFNSPEQYLTVHIRERAFNGELLGLLVQDARNPKEVMMYLAERAAIVHDPAGAFLVMKNGHVHRQAEPHKEPEMIRFDSYAVDLARFEKKGEKVEYRAAERYLDELINPDSKESTYQRNKGQYWAEIHERFSSPLYPIVFVLLTLAFVGQAQSTRQNRGQALINAGILAFAARMGGIALRNIVALNAAVAPFMYVLPLAVGGYALWRIAANARPMKQSRLAAFSEDLADRLKTGAAAVARPVLVRLGLMDAPEAMARS